MDSQQFWATVRVNTSMRKEGMSWAMNFMCRKNIEVAINSSTTYYTLQWVHTHTKTTTNTMDFIHEQRITAQDEHQQMTVGNTPQGGYPSHHECEMTKAWYFPTTHVDASSPLMPQPCTCRCPLRGQRSVRVEQTGNCCIPLLFAPI